MLIKEEIFVFKKLVLLSMDAEDRLLERRNDLWQELLFQGYDSDDAWNIACNETCLSSDDKDYSDEELDDADKMERGSGR